jgi:hypothetical protein
MPGSSDRTLENYTCCRFVVLRIDPGVARVCNQIKWADARAVELVHYAPFDIQISRVLVWFSKARTTDVIFHFPLGCSADAPN